MSDANKKPEDDHEDFLKLFRRGLAFTEELLKENERLRYRLAGYEAKSAEPESTATVDLVEKTVAELKDRINELEAEKAGLLRSYTEAESSNVDFKSRYAEIEEEHNNLANLYIASFQLHSTLVFPEIVRVVAEIVINFVGVQRFAIYLHDAAGARLEAVFAEGQEVSAAAPIVLGDGAVGAAVQARDTFLDEDASSDPRAVIPLVAGEHLVGAIVINELLVQKEAFSRVDHELFHLLSAHAATALLSGLLRHAAGEGAEGEVMNLTTARSLLQN